MKHSPIDGLYSELFVVYPNKAGTALERLATIEYNEFYALNIRADQKSLLRSN